MKRPLELDAEESRRLRSAVAQLRAAQMGHALISAMAAAGPAGSATAALTATVDGLAGLLDGGKGPRSWGRPPGFLAVLSPGLADPIAECLAAYGLAWLARRFGGAPVGKVGALPAFEAAARAAGVEPYQETRR